MPWAGFESMILVYEWNAQRNYRDLYAFLRMGRVARNGEDVQWE